MSKWQPIETAPENVVIIMAQLVPWHGWQYRVCEANSISPFDAFDPTHWKHIKPPEL
jgi:hypothetical protein